MLIAGRIIWVSSMINDESDIGKEWSQLLDSSTMENAKNEMAVFEIKYSMKDLMADEGFDEGFDVRF